MMTMMMDYFDDLAGRVHANVGFLETIMYWMPISILICQVTPMLLLTSGMVRMTMTVSMMIAVVVVVVEHYQHDHQQKRIVLANSMDANANCKTEDLIRIAWRHERNL
jgi:hypothetical protein